MTLRTLNYGNYGIFLIMGNAGFCPSAVCTTIMERFRVRARKTHQCYGFGVLLLWTLVMNPVKGLGAPRVYMVCRACRGLGFRV